VVPPTISDLQPSNQSTVYSAQPVVGANYSDPFGINTSSVILEVDFIDVTSTASITPIGVTYVPNPPLSDGIHDASLEVKDDTINQNLATTSWWFTVDTPPTVKAWEPGGSPGQSYTQGDTIQVKWNSTDGNPLPANPINISYGDQVGGWSTIATGEANDGSYDWVTSGVPCPGSYWMNISAFDSLGQTGFGESNTSFDLFCPGDSAPIISAWEPGGSAGQSFIRGDIVTVTWVASDDNVLPFNPINISYGDPVGGWTSISTNQLNDQTYPWDTTTVPCPGTYRMNISVYDSSSQTAYSESNSTFDIECPDTTPPLISSVQPLNFQTQLR
jgi:hypothetical protein